MLGLWFNLQSQKCLITKEEYETILKLYSFLSCKSCEGVNKLINNNSTKVDTV